MAKQYQYHTEGGVMVTDDEAGTVTHVPESDNVQWLHFLEIRDTLDVAPIDSSEQR